MVGSIVNEVHVWSISLKFLNHNSKKFNQLSKIVIDKRSTRQKRENDSQVLGFLRFVLQKTFPLLKIESIEVESGDNGKPTLMLNRKSTNIFFNFSHSGEFLVAAIASSEVGIDIEHRRKLKNVPRFIKRILSPQELDKVNHSEDEALKIWVRKEAILKAIGIGIRINLKTFSAISNPACLTFFKDNEPTVFSIYWSDVAVNSGIWLAVASSEKFENVYFHSVDELSFFEVK